MRDKFRGLDEKSAEIFLPPFIDCVEEAPGRTEFRREPHEGAVGGARYVSLIVVDFGRGQGVPYTLAEIDQRIVVVSCDQSRLPAADSASKSKLEGIRCGAGRACDIKEGRFAGRIARKTGPCPRKVEYRRVEIADRIIVLVWFDARQSVDESLVSAFIEPDTKDQTDPAPKVARGIHDVPIQARLIYLEVTAVFFADCAI